jgi:hypothetical protein
VKKVLIPLSTGAAARALLRTNFCAEAARVGLHVIFAVPGEKIDTYRHECRGVAECDVFPATMESGLFERICRLCEKWCVHSRFMYLHHFFFLWRRGSRDHAPLRLALFCVRISMWVVGGYNLFRRAFRVLYSWVPALSTRTYLMSHRPALVFCPSLPYGGEWDFLKEARRLGIPTVGMTASWDTLCSKTFLRVLPDYLFVQTGSLVEQAVSLCGYPRTRIRVVGAPQYDRHFLREGVVTRDVFMRSLGVDPAQRLIVYAYSGKISEEVDNRMLAVLKRVIDARTDKNKIVVLVRPYPKRNFSSRKAAWVRDLFGFFVPESVTAVGAGKDKWELSDEALAFMANSLAHADVVVTACSTFLVEAAIFGAPLIGVSYDAGLKVNSWNSLRRVREWEHIANVERTGGVWFVENDTEVTHALDAYMHSRDLKSAERVLLVHEQTGGTAGHAARVIAETLRIIISP